MALIEIFIEHAMDSKDLYFEVKLRCHEAKHLGVEDHVMYMTLGLSEGKVQTSVCSICYIVQS